MIGSQALVCDMIGSQALMCDMIGSQVLGCALDFQVHLCYGCSFPDHLHVSAIELGGWVRYC